MTSAIVRPASAAEVPVIARWEGLSDAEIASTLALPTTLAFAAFTGAAGPGEACAGHVIASAVADQGEILWITVDPSSRRTGVAQALLAAVDAAWIARGVTEAWLEVRADNVAARTLYRRLGWQERARRPTYYRDGADAIVLCRGISRSGPTGRPAVT